MRKKLPDMPDWVNRAGLEKFFVMMLLITGSLVIGLMIGDSNIPRAIPLLVAILLPALALVANPLWALKLLIIALPLDWFVIETPVVNLGVANALLLIILLGLVGQTVLKQTKALKRATSFNWVVGLAAWYLVANLISSVWAETGTPLRYMVTVLGSMLCLLVPSWILRTRITFQLKRLVQIYVIVAVISALVAVLNMTTGNLFLTIHGQFSRGRLEFLDMGRNPGMFGSYGQLGMFMLAALAILLVSLTSKKRLNLFPPSLAQALSIVLGSAIFLLQNRGVWIASLAVLLLFTAFRAFEHPGRNPIAVLRKKAGQLVFLSVVLLLALQMPVIYDVLYELKPKSVDMRFLLIETGTDLFISSPWIGVGPKQFFTVTNLRLLHNFYLNAFVSLGVFGGIPVLLLISLIVTGVLLGWMKNSRSEKGELYLALFLAMLSILVELLFIEASYSKVFWTTMGLGLAALSARESLLHRPIGSADQLISTGENAAALGR